MASKEESKIDKKTKVRWTNELLEEVHDTVKEDLCKSVAEDVRSSFDKEFKEDLKQQISEEIIGDIKVNIKKEQAKLNRRKTFKIIRLYIYIILLMAACLLAIYKLYSTGNLDVVKKQMEHFSTTTTTTQEVKDFNWYLSKYGHLLDNLYITNIEMLKANYTLNMMKAEDLLAMTYHTLESEEIINEGIIVSIEESVMQKAYEKIFGTLEYYKKMNFDVDGFHFAYSVKTNQYIAVGVQPVEKENVVHEIYDIKEENNRIIISAYVALVKEDKIYNIHDTKKALGDYTMGVSLKSIEKSLSKVSYTFDKVEDNYFIREITAK